MDQSTLQAVHEALDDEYKARATYRAILERFGEIRPFINIVDAEDRHASALCSLLRRRGLVPPPDRWAGRAKAPESVEQACRDAVQAEIDNDAMYERLLADVHDDEVRGVMRRLQAASRDRHLPAFQRCVQRRGRGPAGPGNGRGRGRGGCGGRGEDHRCGGRGEGNRCGGRGRGEGNRCGSRRRGEGHHCGGRAR